MAKHQTRLSTQNASMATRGTPPRKAKATRKPLPAATARRLPTTTTAAAAKRTPAAVGKAAPSVSVATTATTVPVRTTVAAQIAEVDGTPEPAPSASVAATVSRASPPQQLATSTTSAEAAEAGAPLAAAALQPPLDAPVASAAASVSTPLTVAGAPDRRFGRRGGRKPRQTTPLPPQVMEPYDGLTCRVVREECCRRRISIWSKENCAYRHKQGYIQLLRMDDQRRAAQDASAQRHKQDLEAIERGALEAPAAAPASPAAAAEAATTSFLSPSALAAPAPADVAAAKVPAHYAPKALLTEPERPVAPSAAPQSAPTAGAATKRAPGSRASPSAGPPVRVVRARRSCYIRLINVVLSSEFNVRWHEMDDAIAGGDSTADVNQFWLDVHVAFMSVNQLYDGLHFHDPLFRLIDPSTILAHEASRLRQMWYDVVRLYQCAVARATQAAGASDDDAQLSFYEHCLKRLDVLYLHMGLLLEPELSARITKMVPTNPHGSQRLQSASARSSGAGATVLRNGKAKRARSSPASATTSTKASASTPKRGGTKQSPARAPKPVTQRATPPPAPPSLETPDARESPAQVPADEPQEQSYALVVSGELRDAAFETFAPHALQDDGYGSSDYDGDLPPRTMTSRKRRRSDTSTDIVELHSSSIVPHASSARMAHSTALTTRSGPSAASTDVMLPLDEWDILEGRIRKVNESLDRCHRALSGADGLVSDSHRMTLEHDLRFYSAIKQRLQEQLLMVMQGY